MELLLLLLMGATAVGVITRDDSLDNDDDSSDNDNVPDAADDASNLIDIHASSKTAGSDAAEGYTAYVSNSSADTQTGQSDEDYIRHGDNTDTFVYDEQNIPTPLPEIWPEGPDEIISPEGPDEFICPECPDEDYITSGEPLDIFLLGQETIHGDQDRDIIFGGDTRPTNDPSSAFSTNMSELAGLTDLTDVTSFEGFIKSGMVHTYWFDYGLGEDINDNDVLYGGGDNDLIFADFSDTVYGGGGEDALHVASVGEKEAVVVNDFNPAEDTLTIYVPAGTDQTITFVNGATASDGVSVMIAGDTVAVLKGLFASDIGSQSIFVKNDISFT